MTFFISVLKIERERGGAQLKNHPKMIDNKTSTKLNCKKILGPFFYVVANVLFVVVVNDVKLSGIWILLPTMWTAVAAPTGHIT